MTSTDWLAVPIGTALILLALLDVSLTVLHVQVESPISNRLNRWLWLAVTRATRHLPRRVRDALLGWGAPLMIVSIIAFWCVLYISGFALIYLGWIHDPTAFKIDDGAMTSPLADAFYFSGASFFTLGYGDISPIHAVSRTLAIFEAALGLLTISLTVTYLLSIYPLITRKAVSAASLNQESAGRTDGVTVAARYVAGGRFEALGERLRSANAELLEIGEAHSFYPVLYYIRPHDVHESFVRVLAVVQGIVATLRYGLDPTAHRDVVTDPRLIVLEEGLLYTLHGLSQSSHLSPEDETEEDVRRARADYLALLDALEGQDLSTRSRDDRRGAEAYARFRSATERYIRAYAVNIGYEPSAVWATYSRWDRDSALTERTERDRRHGAGSRE